MSTRCRCLPCRRPRNCGPNAERLAEALGAPLPAHLRESPIELRSAGPLSIELARDPSLRGQDDHSNLVWVRVTERLPDDPLLHVCLMTYVSDLTLLETALLEHGVSWLDGRRVGREPGPRHVVPPPVPRRPVAALRAGVAGRRGRPGPRPRPGVHRRGDLVVSVVQEGLIRISDTPRD